MHPKAILLTGTVGVGKTTTATAVAQRLSERGESAGLIDLDGLSRLWPAPADDPFRTRLTLADLESMVGNVVAAGAGSDRPGARGAVGECRDTMAGCTWPS